VSGSQNRQSKADESIEQRKINRLTGNKKARCDRLRKKGGSKMKRWYCSKGGRKREHGRTPSTTRSFLQYFFLFLLVRPVYGLSPPTSNKSNSSRLLIFIPSTKKLTYERFRRWKEAAADYQLDPRYQKNLRDCSKSNSSLPW
jgi:hypothetical protein